MDGRRRLTVIAAEPLPPGWTGKLWAVQQGVEQALKLDPAFLLLTDADIHHAPDNIATLVAIAEAGNYDLTSFMVKLHCRSMAEKLLIPAFVFFFFMLYPPAWIRDPKRKIAGAAGGCMLIRPRALQKAGGISAIRDQIIDDCALARAVKRTGGRVWLGVTPETFSTRAYNSFAEIERMIARTAFNQLQHSAALLAGAIVGMADHLFASVGVAGERTPLVGHIGRAMLAAHGRRLLPDGAFLRTWSAVGVHASAECIVLHVCDRPLGHPVLVWPRRHVEGPFSG